ncbi:hypothetical protein BGX34_010194 [Mortierella sp. NVP85]|nr:hypothetical protein BGX34_010194 [Mortierella sp. NVP85]
MPLQMVFVKDVKVTKDVKFKVKLNTLLLPERGTLADLRSKLKKAGHSDDPMNPSPEYLESMHPQDPEVLANLPEEAGTIDPDGTYTLHGEWIEALEDLDNPDPRPRSKTVILYFHGGGYVFCSTASHRHMLAQLARDVGPGTRVFSVGYRLAPEHPFPAAIHDAFAAYLYLTEPEHAAVILDEDSAAEELAVDPKDIVLAGDSAGGNLAAAFMQYMIKYVQPRTEPKFELPHATLMLSPWMDITSSLPTAQCFDWYCYCPGPIGTSPFDMQLYVKYKKASLHQLSLTQNFGSLYVCGDATFVPNNRNALGIDRRWEWYSHLAQHPLVTPVFSTQGTLKGMNNVLIQSASHDRLVDDSRLIAHRYGLENKDRLVRVEQYKDMVHVHQIFYLFFESSRIASKNLARFVERSLHHRSEEEKAHRHNGETDPNRSYANAVLRKPPVQDQRPANEDYVPAFMAATMVKEKSASDGVEWVLVRQSGRELAGDEGVPLETLIQSWDARGGEEVKEE